MKNIVLLFITIVLLAEDKPSSYSPDTERLSDPASKNLLKDITTEANSISDDSNTIYINEDIDFGSDVSVKDLEVTLNEDGRIDIGTGFDANNTEHLEKAFLINPNTKKKYDFSNIQKGKNEDLVDREEYTEDEISLMSERKAKTARNYNLLKHTYGSKKIISNETVKELAPNSSFSETIDFLDKFKEDVRKASEDKIISCQIERQIVPAYRCSIPAYSGITYGGGGRSNESLSKELCESNCLRKPSDGCKMIPGSANYNISNFSDSTSFDVPKSITYKTETSGSKFPSTMKTIIVNEKAGLDKIGLNFKITNQASGSVEDDLSRASSLVSVTGERLTVLVDVIKTSKSSVLNTPLSAEEILEKKNLGLEEDEFYVYEKKELVFHKPEQEFILYLNNVVAKNIKLRFWEPSFSNPTLYKSGEKISDDELNIILNETKVFYDGVSASNANRTGLYFCPFTQISLTPYNKCPNGTKPKTDTSYMLDLKDGESDVYIENDDFSNLSYSSNEVWLCDSDVKGDDEVTGGYYSLDSCNNDCTIQAECFPEFKPPSGINENSINYEENYYDIDINCVDMKGNVIEETQSNATGEDDASNASTSFCTKEICEKLFKDLESNILNESVFLSDNREVSTIQDGLDRTNLEKGFSRPKVDISNELKAHNKTDGLLFSDVMKKEKVDASYLNMLDNITYVHSSYKIGEKTQRESSYESFSGINGSSIYWNFKPSNEDFDSTIKYFYVVAEIQHKYVPRYGIFQIGSKEYDAKEDYDRNVTFIDKTYLINSSGIWKKFNTDEFYYKNTIKEIPSIFYLKNQQPIPEKKEYTEEFLEYKFTKSRWKLSTDGGTATSISPESDEAEFFASEAITNDKIVIKNKVVNGINELMNFEGVFLRGQKEDTLNSRNLIKVHDGEIENLKNTSALHDLRIYAVVSDIPLTYSELKLEALRTNEDETKTSDDYGLKYVNLLYGMNSKSYLKQEISGDSNANDNVKMYIQGKSTNMKVYGDIKPRDIDVDKDGFLFIFLVKEDE
jgi:hypothetical protein